MASRNRAFGFWMALPAVVVLALLVAVPLVQTVIYSFQEVSFTRDNTWVGLANYISLIGSDLFQRSFVITAIFTVEFVVLSTLLGLGFALLLNQQFIGKSVARALLIIPWAIPWLFVGIVWRWFVDGQVGALNLLLSDLGLIDRSIFFLADGTAALQLAILAAVWRQSALSGLLYLATLQTLPKEYVEAATVDGANRWQVFRHITLPWLKPITFGIVILNVIFGALQFDTVFAMTQGGPGDATQLLSLVLYRELFVFTDFGSGAAMALLLAAFALAAAAIFARFAGRRLALD